MAQTARIQGRGRNADTPRAIPRAGWRDVFLRVKDGIGKDNLGLVAAGVAFYFLLAIFPALAAFVSIYGLVFDPTDAQQQVSNFSDILPPDARKILLDQMQTLTSGTRSALGFGAAFGILFALWSSMRGTMAMMTALNIVYNERESRGFIKLRVIAFLFTLGMVLFLAASLALIAALPPVLAQIGIGHWVETALRILRWPLLAVFVMLMLAVFYRYAPDRNSAQWRWVNPGSILATLLWLVGSALFSWYVSSYARYNETYGSLGAVVILLMWFYLTAYIFLVGAEVSAEMEHQTNRDTTEGEEKPMGERGAYVADTVGEKP